MDENSCVQFKHRLQPVSSQHFFARTLTAGNFWPGFPQERCTAVFGFFPPDACDQEIPSLELGPVCSLWSHENRDRLIKHQGFFSRIIISGFPECWLE